MSIVYLSGPYRGRVEENVEQARRAAVELWKRGWAVICPHLNTHGFEREGIDLETFLVGDLELVAVSDVVAVLPGWEESVGSTIEVFAALLWGVPVHTVEDLLYRNVLRPASNGPLATAVGLMVDVLPCGLRKGSSDDGNDKAASP